MKITVAVMAHPKRAKQAKALYKKLVQWPFLRVFITWDQQDNEWHTGSRALLTGASQEGDWHVVIQDDAILADNFYDELVAAINNVPERSLISLYTGTVRPFRGRVELAVKRADRASWLRGYTLFWGVGIAIPTFHIEPMLEFVTDRDDVPYDARIGVFYQKNRVPVFYTNPSLVDHDDTFASLVGNDRAELPRVAHNFIGGRNVKWNSEIIDI